MLVDVFHSVCIVYYRFFFFKNRTIFDLEDKFLPVSNMASSGLKKTLDLINLYTHKSVSENVCPVSFVIGHKKTDNMVFIRQMVSLGICYCLKIVVVVKTTRCYNLI